MAASPLARNFYATFPAQRGGGTFATWILLLVVFGAQVFAGAVEQRGSSQSPLVALPGIGRVAQILREERLAIALIGVSILAVAHAVTLKRERPGHWARVALLAWMGLTTLVTTVNAVFNHSSSIPQLLQLVAAGSAFVAIMLLASSLDLVHGAAILAVLLVTVLLLNAFFLVEAPTWSDTLDWPGGFISGPRLQGTFPQPNVAGEVFALAVIFFSSISKSRPILTCLGCALAGYLVFLTGSRGALVMLVGALCYALLRRIGPRTVLAAGVGLGLAAALVPLTNLSASQFIHGRAVSWNEAKALIYQSPVWGEGIFPDGYDAGFYAHNQVLQTAVEAGMVGLLFLSLGIFAALREASRSTMPPVWGAILFGTLCTFAFENPLRFYRPEFGLLPSVVAMTVGLVVAISKDDIGNSEGDAEQSLADSGSAETGNLAARGPG
ncbi:MULTISPECIES: O-antigen ligase family protein [unclassified Nocardioides]|uniref:O-antigen ligase family protein n=1 Tax=unclassified Nocardioides TaxID=2615069 RepID=UPI0013FD8179|nr:MULTISPECIES: O-antigen ligase family protein [unclassified Nocardioides]